MSTASITVTVNERPQPNISGDNEICNGESTTLTASGGTSYSWSNGQSSASISVAPASTATYQVTATDANGCTGTASYTVIVHPLPNPAIVGNTTICQGQSTSLFVSGGIFYNWSNGAAVAQIMVSPAATASYQVTVSDANGCSVASNPVIVTVRSPLALSAVYPDSVCKNSNATVQLLASGGDGNYSYTWSNGLTGSQNQILVSGNTSLTVQLADGCNTPPVSAAVAITAVEAPTLSFNIPQQTGCEPLVTNFAIPS